MNTSVKQEILAKIKEYDRILIFRHKRVDGDCVGASKGLKELLKASFPEKDVRIIDDERSDYLAFLGPDDEAVPDDFYASALAIVVDVADTERISNQKFSLCKEIVKIDHHIDRTPYGVISWVEEGRSAACEMIADFYATFQDELTLTQWGATCIYTGMVTDSGRFMYEGVSGDSMRLAGLILDKGVKTDWLYANLYLKTFESLKFTAYVYEHMKVTENGVCWLLVDKAMQQKFGLNMESASAAISSLSGIRGCLCWIAFIETGDEEHAIRVRLRSRFAAINHIAEKYHGGGHACASGATVYSVREMHDLLRDADTYIKEYKENNEGWL
ncbi:MAG: bifunctional oligoribonuclease/PAP phosphatase NrnA [Clostridiales bacterium]|nr:bifunctional oligoribonuclease/PAP phosphatase NrnA [Clostridiales bacterium]